MVVPSRITLFLRREWLSTSAPACVVVSIRKKNSLAFRPLSHSRTGHTSSTKTDLSFCQGIETVPGRALAASCDPRLLLKVSLYRRGSIVSSYETLKHSTNAMAPFTRVPLNLTTAFFIVMLFGFWRSWKLISTVCKESARELWLDTEHISLAHSLDASVGLAQLIISIELSRQRTLLLLLQFTPPARSILPPPPSPPLSFFLSRFNR